MDTTPSRTLTVNESSISLVMNWVPMCWIMPARVFTLRSETSGCAAIVIPESKYIWPARSSTSVGETKTNSVSSPIRSDPPADHASASAESIPVVMVCPLETLRTGMIVWPEALSRRAISPMLFSITATCVCASGVCVEFNERKATSTSEAAIAQYAICFLRRL